MNTHNSKLQSEIDDILDGVHHFFDDIAEYAEDSDPAKVVDLDNALTIDVPINNFTPQPRRTVSQPQPTAHKDISSFPANPQKIVIAMPFELQQEVKMYESQISAKKKSQSIFTYALKRLKF